MSKYSDTTTYSDATIYSISRVFKRFNILTQRQYVHIVTYCVSSQMRTMFDQYTGAQKGFTDLYVYTANGREKIL